MEAISEDNFYFRKLEYDTASSGNESSEHHHHRHYLNEEKAKQSKQQNTQHQLLSSLIERKHIKEYLFKVLVIGDTATGKTCFVQRLVYKHFRTQYKATIGLDFALKIINWDENTIVRLQLWDIAGQERCSNLTRAYFRDAVGALLFFDVSRASSFHQVLHWKNDLDSKVALTNNEPIPCILMANKCDLNKEGIAKSALLLEKFCKENNFLTWFYTSSKLSINHNEAIIKLIENIIEKVSNKAINFNSDDENDNLTKLNSQEQKKCACEIF